MNFELKENGSLKAFINPALGDEVKKEDLSVAEYNAKVEALVNDLSSGKLSFHSFQGKDGRWIIGFK